MTIVAQPEGVAVARPPGRGVRALDRAAEVLEIFSQQAVRIATVIVIGGSVIAAATIVAGTFARYVLNSSIFGSDEFASFCFLWVIWMGVSLAVKRGAVTVITMVADHGPPWWQRSVRTFSGLSLAILLVYCCYWSTVYAMSSEALVDTSASLGILKFYPVASMTVGYYFITLHYTQALVMGAARVMRGGRVVVRYAAEALVGAVAVGAVVWAICYGVLALGASKLLALGVIFVALTLAGNPIIFMLSIVGIISTMNFLGLEFYSNTGKDPLFPFRTTQTSMGLTGGSELIVILMFLIVANLMNAAGMTDRLIRFAAACIGHLRGGMAYVCQLTSAAVSGISGSAQADAAIMTPILVPAMEKEGYPRDVAAAVVAGASIKGPIGPISIMFIVYGFVSGLFDERAVAPFNKLLFSGIFAEGLLLIFQAATVYLVVRKLGFFKPRPFSGMRVVGRTGRDALPVLTIPFIIIGGIIGGVFLVNEAGAMAVVVALALAFFWYGSLAPRELPAILTLAGIETGIVLLLVGDSSILGTVLQNNGFSDSLAEFFTGITHNKYVFLLLVNLLLLGVGIFVEPLPALYILAPALAYVAVVHFGIDPTHFGLIMVFNLVLALIHPPIGLVIFLVSSLARVSVERLSITILPWLAVSLIVLFLVTYLPSAAVLALTNAVT